MSKVNVIPPIINTALHAYQRLQYLLLAPDAMRPKTHTSTYVGISSIPCIPATRWRTVTVQLGISPTYSCLAPTRACFTHVISFCVSYQSQVLARILWIVGERSRVEDPDGDGDLDSVAVVKESDGRRVGSAIAVRALTLAPPTLIHRSVIPS